MPNGHKKRPDTLELEVLGGVHLFDSSDDGCTKKSINPEPKSSKLQSSIDRKATRLASIGRQKASSPETIDDQPIDNGAGNQQMPLLRRWFHFGRRSLNRHSPTTPATSSSICKNKPEYTAADVISMPVGMAMSPSPFGCGRKATLAKPEKTTIANSSNTIITSLPSSQTITDVAGYSAQPPPGGHRNNINTITNGQKQPGHKTQTAESLNSLSAFAAATADRHYGHPKSEPNVHNDINSSTTDHAAGPLWRSSIGMHTTLDQRNNGCSEVDRKLSLLSVTTDISHLDSTVSGVGYEMDAVEEAAAIIDKAGECGTTLPAAESSATPAIGLRASLLSVLGKLAIWKCSKCHQRKLSQTSRSGDAISGIAVEAGSSRASVNFQRSGNASSDFEQLSTTPDGGGLFASVRKKSIRRLSQIRRRRSSYYFSENERRIRANDRDFNSQYKYTDNYIKTSKYSLLTFLPFNLLEQFQRLANFYFLCLLVLQLVPAISSLTPVTTAIPLIGVLTLTAVKDAYDDIQRHLSDSQVNNRKSKSLRNGRMVDEKWSGVQVGDVIRLENNQFVAADILLLTTSEPNGLCFIETAELDGETNLKSKQCLPETIEMGQRHDLLWNFNGEIICERPNNLLNKFEGTLIWKNQRYALDNEKILLRGCVLRNTQWCYGVVIFAGKDTKLMQNSGKTQFKSTGVDRLLNFIIIGIVLFLLSICAFFTLACAVWENFIGQHFQAYLPWETIIPKDVAQGATVIGLLVFFSYAIVLNTVVPISLYVSVEVIRFAQSFLINWDEQMFHEPTKTNAKARTTTLNEELGQIQYIFSDKTGTLTQNIMTFNKCSINGRTYGDVIDLRTGEVIEVTDKQNILQNSNNPNSNNSKCTTPPTILLHKVDVHPKDTIIVSNVSDDGTPSAPPTSLQSLQFFDQTDYSSTSVILNECQTGIENPEQGNHGKHVKYADNVLAHEIPSSPTRSSSNWSSLSPTSPSTPTTSTSNRARFRRQQSSLSDASDKALEPVDFSANPEYESDFRWYDKTLLDAVRSDEEHAHNFFRLLALCHTVMPEYVEGRLEYQAQSPDEAALVSAARNFGFVFRSRTPNSITIEVMGRTEEYELLNILDFNNVRKRMSVILRRGNSIILYCKGADNVIYDRLSTSQHDIKGRTQEHLNKFAGEGLRTLVLAERRLDSRYFNEWRERQQEASISLDNREDKLGAIYEEIESEMVLVGVTAIEDKLQDGVPQTIANLQMAGIKIWVLTGDKQETAINIGYSCQLLTDELADVFIVDGSSMEDVEKQLRQFKESIRIVNRFRPAAIEPNVQLNSNGSHYDRPHNTSSIIQGTGVFRSQVSPPPPPAISVVTFRWDEDNIKHNKGEPDSAECNEIYDNYEKGGIGQTTIPDDESIEENSGFAIVINGHSLVYCLSPELETKFLDIASQCKAVICCRVTPLQKALVVELIKRTKSAVTLAIGDGANDVSMIKAAHIGVGISGQEGLQAVLASDYSIAQFRYLERLLLVHGRWSYYRMCKFLRYFFYKNFAFTLCHCWYSFFCGFSAQTVFDPMFISVYNLFYTSLPVLALGVFEQDVSDKHSIEYPKLYTPGLKSQLFNTKEFVYSVLHGAFSSLILFLIPYGTYKDGISPNGYILSDHMTLGAVVATILIIDNTAQIALYTSYWTVFNHIMIWGSLVWYFVLDYFYNYVIGGPYVGSLTQAMQDLTFWATMLITVTVIMAPVLAYKFYLLDVHPSLADKIRLKRRQASLRSRQTNAVMRTPSSRRARRSLRSGYAFAHQEGFGRLITSGKIMRKLPQEFAFPLGLGSKKGHHTTSVPTENSTKLHHTNNNNIGVNRNASMADSNDVRGASNSTNANTVGGGGAGGGGGGGVNNGEEDFSPRAPCQDLDTINL